MEVLNDSNVDMIGVYGIGGVGKTTLVKQVARKVIEDKLFDEVARDLGLEFGQQESMFRRADLLSERLKKEKRVLIILDNIWENFEFDAVGIPFRNNDQERCTIILTSRSRDLLCNMESQNNFLIEVLSNEEAGQLFEKIVGDSAKDSDFQRIGHEIVGKCGGLPVALNTIANALKNKDLPSWKDALNQLKYSNPSKIDGMDANVYSSIEWSYNFLKNNEAKNLFLLCTLHKTGDSINALDLLRYGMGLGLFESVYTLESARNKVHTLIDSLKASCLLLDGDAEDEVKMHDIIQNVADLKEDRINKDSTAISVPYKIQELPERLEFPQLKFLLLSNEYGSSLQIPDLLFEGMKQLKVLKLTKFWFTSLPSSLGCLINLQTLCLESCGLQDIAMVGQLKKLEILSFRYSIIKQLPNEIGQLRHLQLLDLTNCYSLEVIPPNVISKLTQLEELYMGNSFTKWEKDRGGGNASLVELKGLSKLTILDIRIPSAEIIPQDVVSVELERFRIFVGNKLRWPVKYKTSRFMNFERIEKITLLGMKMLVKRTEDLFLKEIKSLQNIVQELDNEEGFPRLKHLRIEKYNEILHIVSSVRQIHCKVFPLLESLSLHNLINLKKVCHGQLTEDQSFSNLRILKVEKCVGLKHLFSFSMAKNLLRLQKIEVDDCSNLEMIVGPDMEKSTNTLGYKNFISKDDSQVKVALPNLMTLRVARCDGLRSLMTLSMAQSMVKLTRMEINDCEKMEEIIQQELGEEVKDDRIVFSQLEYLELGRLPSLKSFCLGNYTLEFSSLEDFYVRNCPNMKTFSQGVLLTPKLHKVKDWEGCGEEYWEEEYWEGNLNSTVQKIFKEMVEFRDKWNLRLSLYPYLKEKWYNQELLFNELRYLEVDDCTDISSAIPMNLVWCLNNLKSLIVSNCDSLEDVFHLEELNIDEHFGPFLPKLESLELINLPKLKRVGNFTGNIIALPSLTSMWIENCSNMEAFVSNSTSVHMTANKEHQEMTLEENLQPFFNENVALPNLMTLHVAQSNGLRSLMTLSMAQSMMKLTSMVIIDCEKMEEIIQQELGEEVKDDRIVFSQLKYLELGNLPSLKSFCLGNYTLEFSSLEQVYVYNLPKYEDFFSRSLAHTKITQSRRKRRVLGRHPKFHHTKNVQKKVGFRYIWDLRLSLYPHLKEK